VRELEAHIASTELMLRDRDAAVAAAEEEIALLRDLIGSASAERSAAVELEGKLAEAEKAVARAQAEREGAAAAAARERDALEARLAASEAEVERLRRAAEESTAEHAREMEAVRAAHAEARATLDASRAQIDSAASLRAESNAIRSQAKEEVARIHDLFLTEQDRRRLVQNLLMEFVGNIRVFSRYVAARIDNVFSPFSFDAHAHTRARARARARTHTHTHTHTRTHTHFRVRPVSKPGDLALVKPSGTLVMQTDFRCTLGSMTSPSRRCLRLLSSVFPFCITQWHLFFGCSSSTAPTWFSFKTRFQLLFLPTHACSR
jgi:hypothetical protein